LGYIFSSLLGKTSGEVIAETGQKDATTRRIYESYIGFRRRATHWADLAERGYLNARALKFPYGDKA
jgi:TRAP-type mannitol/chloroaromatic compound transport system substrate-binding protein